VPPIAVLRAASGRHFIPAAEGVKKAGAASGGIYVCCARFLSGQGHPPSPEFQFCGGVPVVDGHSRHGQVSFLFWLLCVLSCQISIGWTGSIHQL